MTLEDERIIDELLARFGEAWNRHDMNALAELFTENADFVDVFGNWFRGRAEIRAALSARHASVFKDSHFSRKEIRIRFLKPDLALAHAVWELSGARRPEGAEQRSSLGRMTYVMINEDAGWVIAALQNTVVSPAQPQRGE